MWVVAVSAVERLAGSDDEGLDEVASLGDGERGRDEQEEEDGRARR